MAERNITYKGAEEASVEDVDHEAIQSIVEAVRSTCDPEIDFGQYVEALIFSALNEIDFDPEEFAYPVGTAESILATLQPEPSSVVICDLENIFFIAKLLADKKSRCYCNLTFQTFGLTVEWEKALMLISVLEQGLSAYTDRFIGFGEAANKAGIDVKAMPLYNLRRSKAVNVHLYFEMLEFYDPFWSEMLADPKGRSGVLYMNFEDANKKAYEGYKLAPYEPAPSLIPNLARVIELPPSLCGWLFECSREATCSAKMIDLSANEGLILASEKSWREALKTAESIDVDHVILAFKNSYCPRYYLDGNAASERIVPLKELATKIQRGTSLTGKELNVLGTIFKKNPNKKQSASLGENNRVRVAGVGGIGPIGIKTIEYILYGNDHWYIDNSCIKEDGTVEPKVIEKIPDGQDRYTICPEDGICLLVPRNGKRMVALEPQFPTLISDNILLIRLKDELNKEYISCVAQSSLVRAQIRAAKKPLTKDSVGAIRMLLIGESEQKLVVDRNDDKRRRLSSFRKQLDYLKATDPLRPLATEDDSFKELFGQSHG